MRHEANLHLIAVVVHHAGRLSFICFARRRRGRPYRYAQLLERRGGNVQQTRADAARGRPSCGALPFVGIARASGISSSGGSRGNAIVGIRRVGRAAPAGPSPVDFGGRQGLEVTAVAILMPTIHTARGAARRYAAAAVATGCIGMRLRRRHRRSLLFAGIDRTNGILSARYVLESKKFF